MKEIHTSGAFVGEEELALAKEGGSSERLAMLRRLGKKRKPVASGLDEEATNLPGRQAARQILDAAAAAKPKKIAKADLKKAISLYAGPQATDKEKAAVASKMLDFLKKRQIDLSA